MLLFRCLLLVFFLRFFCLLFFAASPCGPFCFRRFCCFLFVFCRWCWCSSRCYFLCFLSFHFPAPVSCFLLPLMQPTPVVFLFSLFGFSVFCLFCCCLFCFFLSYRPLLYYPIFFSSLVAILFLVFVLSLAFPVFRSFISVYSVCSVAYPVFLLLFLSLLPCLYLFLFFWLPPFLVFLSYRYFFCFFVDVSFVSSFLGGGSIAGCRVLCVGSSIGPVADADKFLSSRAKNLAV